MAPIDFFYMPESPPCRAVELLAAVVGVELNKHHVNLATGEHLKDEYLKVNPQRKVPFIVDGDLRMGESRAIMMYLVNKYKPDNEHLYPRDSRERAQIDELLFYDIWAYEQASSRLYYPLMQGKTGGQNEENERAYKVVPEYLNKRLDENGAKRFLLGNQLTIADISLAASFSLVHACGYNLHEFKHLTAYLERLKSTIPNYSEINDKPIENMRQFILSVSERNRT